MKILAYSYLNPQRTRGETGNDVILKFASLARKMMRPLSYFPRFARNLRASSGERIGGKL